MLFGRGCIYLWPLFLFSRNPPPTRSVENTMKTKFDQQVENCRKILRKSGNLASSVVVLNTDSQPYAREVMRQALFMEDANVTIGPIEKSKDFGDLFFSIKKRPGSRNVGGFEQLEIFGQAADYCNGLAENTSLAQLVCRRLEVQVGDPTIPFMNSIERMQDGFYVDFNGFRGFISPNSLVSDAIFYARIVGMI